MAQVTYHVCPRCGRITGKTTITLTGSDTDDGTNYRKSEVCPGGCKRDEEIKRRIRKSSI